MSYRICNNPRPPKMKAEMFLDGFIFYLRIKAGCIMYHMMSQSSQSLSVQVICKYMQVLKINITLARFSPLLLPSSPVRNSALSFPRSIHQLPHETTKSSACFALRAERSTGSARGTARFHVRGGWASPVVPERLGVFVVFCTSGTTQKNLPKKTPNQFKK